jgi:hypothetical protein
MKLKFKFKLDDAPSHPRTQGMELGLQICIICIQIPAKLREELFKLIIEFASQEISKSRGTPYIRKTIIKENSVLVLNVTNPGSR